MPDGRQKEVSPLSEWKQTTPGKLALSGTDFTITAESDGDFALRYRGKPFAGCGTLGYAKMRTLDHIKDCAEIGTSLGTPDKTISQNWT